MPNSEIRFNLVIIAVGIAACILVAAIGMAVASKMPAIVQTGIPGKLKPGAVRNAGACRLHAIKNISACKAKLQKEGRTKLGIIAGDSHARAGYNALNRHARRRGSSLLSLTELGCVPNLGVDLVRTTTGKVFGCHRAKERGFAFIFDGDVSPSYAVLYARWNNATPWLTADGKGGDQYRFLRDQRTGAVEPKRELFIESLRRTIRLLQDAGVNRVLVILASPEFHNDPSSCIIRSDRYGIDRDRHCSVPTAEILNRRFYSAQWMREAVQGMPDVRLIDPMPVFCDTDLCRGFSGGGVLYRDYNHLNDAGMRALIDRYREDFNWVVG